MAHVALDWRIAQVSEGKLTVPLAELPGSFWVRAFRARLDSNAETAGTGAWGDVELDGRTLVVERVAKGSEPALRQFLEDVVAESNLEAERLMSEASRQHARDAHEEVRSEGEDEEMTRRFRDGS
jgi:hypothetical protein